jgi:hypothetical protein
MKRLCAYKSVWEGKYPWLKLCGTNSFEAFCNIFFREFSIAHGENDIKKHSNSDIHTKKERSSKQGMKLESFFISSETERNSVTAADLGLVYHTVKHNLSYSNMDCANKICPVTFNDSKIALKVQCGRTKAEMLAGNVMAPQSVSKVTRGLKKK